MVLVLAGWVGVLFIKVIHEEVLGGRVPGIVVLLATTTLPTLGGGDLGSVGGPSDQRQWNADGADSSRGSLKA